MSRAVPSGAGTANITKTFIADSHDRKSLPTQVHVRPSNINCNCLRADFSLTKFNPAVLIGNWNEQRTFDKVNTVDPTLKNKGFHYNHVESVKHDKKCPPTMTTMHAPALRPNQDADVCPNREQGGVEPRYTTESRFMAKWLPPADESLPDVEVCCDTIGKPLYADVDPSLYVTTASYIGTDTKVRLH